MRQKVLFALFLMTGMIFLIEQSNAIPAFARKYRLSCRTCHTPAAPKLKAFGDTFAGDGFKLEDEKAPRYYVETGDEKLSLIRNFPLAVRLDGFVAYNMAGNEKSDFEAPYLMKFLSGGEISEHLSYYFYFYANERGEVAGVEDAFLMYDNLFGTDFDIYLGQFQVSDPLFKRELRLQLEDYRLYTSQIGTSSINMTYDKGVMFTYGLPTGTSFTLEVLNGNGIGEARNHVFDKDKYKNVLGRVSQDIGEMLRIGAFGYVGKEKLSSGPVGEITNEAVIWGPDLTFSVTDRWELNFQYLHREDSQVFPASNAIDYLEDVSTDGAMAELIFMPDGDQSDWYLLGMYNYVDSDFEPADYQSATFHAGYLLRRNVRLAGEYTLDFTDSDNTISKFSFGFVSAF
ncbi:MAG: hypothetical protein K9I94_00520 [Bacteroidales bacterium]|nr:hypothetical protein [Bacteroidales bacterium]